MGEHSKIEWTDHTFNPWWGCEKVSDACKHCYAEAFAKRTGHDIWGPKADRRFFADKHWQEPQKWNALAAKAGVRRKVFCASMADVFEDREDLAEPRARLIRLIERTEHLDWLLLTKRPEHMARLGAAAGWSLGDWPDNVWAGTTLESCDVAKRVDALLQVEAPYHFLSCEPLLGSLRGTVLGQTWDRGAFPGEVARSVDWIICGGESGPHARSMHPTWATELRDAALAAERAFFFKQWGDWEPMAEASAYLDGVLEMDSKEWKGMLSGIVLLGYDGAVTVPERPYEKWLVDQSHKMTAEWDSVPEDRRTVAMHRVGKHVAGRLLDGRTWSEFPDGGRAPHTFVEEITPSKSGGRYRRRRCTGCDLTIGMRALTSGRCQPRPDAGSSSKHQLELLP